MIRGPPGSTLDRSWAASDVYKRQTNHLDMESIESLNTGLEKFPGTLVFVSHDREFVSSLATRVFEVKGDGKIVDYLGGYEDYLASQGVS